MPKEAIGDLIPWNWSYRHYPLQSNKYSQLFNCPFNFKTNVLPVLLNLVCLCLIEKIFTHDHSEYWSVNFSLSGFGNRVILGRHIECVQDSLAFQLEYLREARILSKYATVLQ